MLPHITFDFCGEGDDGLEKFEENRIDGEFKSGIARARGKIFVTKFNSASCLAGRMRTGQKKDGKCDSNQTISSSMITIYKAPFIISFA